MSFSSFFEFICNELKQFFEKALNLPKLKFAFQVRIITQLIYL